MRTRTRSGKLRTSGFRRGGIPLLGLCLLLAGCGGDAPTAAARPANELDVFLIAGQSNARGRGDRLLSPDVPTGVAFVWSVKDLALVEADDPVGDARTGSAWPAFALRYHGETGRRPVLIPTAVGGSAQHVSAATQYGHWDAGQSHYPVAVQKVRTALTEMKRLGYTPVFRGVLWDQGGRDAQAIAAGSTTKDQYRSALEAMLARFRGEFGAEMPFWIILLGTDAGTSPIGWTQVREAQKEVAQADPFTHIAFSETVTFYPAYHTDRFHYNQEGLNRIGEGLAEYVAAELFGGG